MAVDPQRLPGGPPSRRSPHLQSSLGLCQWTVHLLAFISHTWVRPFKAKTAGRWPCPWDPLSFQIVLSCGQVHLSLERLFSAGFFAICLKDGLVPVQLSSGTLTLSFSLIFKSLTLCPLLRPSSVAWTSLGCSTNPSHDTPPACQTSLFQPDAPHNCSYHWIILSPGLPSGCNSWPSCCLIIEENKDI